MKKLLLMTALGLLFVPTILHAQDDVLKKPKDSGISEFDDFKNNAFSIYKSSREFKAMVDNGDKFSADDVKAVNKLQEDTRAMKDKTEQMVKSAKKAKPMTKAPQAGKNTQAAGKALEAGGTNLQYVVDNMVKAEE
ncbi:MAG: hypothetical protein GY816_03140 [Cytophagales bacterium]|nr:hypothetical protein [Cytophagales bacterium]